MQHDSWTDTDLAYFAGILDGEGCLSIDTVGRYRGRRYHNPRLRVVNTDARLIQWIQTRFPAKVSPRKARGATFKPQWEWDLFGPAVETVLVAVLPYLVIKREQAELLVEYRRTMRPRGQKPGWRKGDTFLSSETIVRRDAMKSRLTVLNQRGAAS